MAQKIRTAALFLSTALVAPGVTFAQDKVDMVPGGVSTDPAAEATDDTAQEGAEIIVSARRRDERLLDAPVAITAVGGQTLQDYSVSRVTDLATLVPSLVAGKAASGSSASIFLRGVGSTALSAGFDQSVSFVIDGLPMSRGREISLPQYDVQRVEVLKGPQALFFGKNTTGGLISISTNNPTNNLEAGIKAGYGFEAQEKYTEAFVSGPLSDSLRARIAGRYSNSEGAFTNTAAATYPTPIPGQVRTSSGKYRGGAENFGARGTLDWDATDTLNLQLKAGFSQVNDGGPTDLIERICGGGRTVPATANGVPPSPNADCRIDGRSDSSDLPVQVAQANYRYARDGELYSDFNSRYAVLKGTIESEPFDVTSITGYYKFKQTDLNNVSGEAYPASFSQLADWEQYSEELRFQSKFDGPFNILFGGFYAHGKFIFNTDAYIFPVPIDPVRNTFVTFKRDNGFATDSMSLFAEATVNLSEQLEVSGGARYSEEARNSFQQSLPAHIAFAAAFPGNISLRDRYRESNISPQATVRYKPEPDTTIYAAYKQGFKAGGFNISQALGPTANVADGRYNSETAEGGEVGLRTLQFDRSLALNVTAYHYVYSDLQVQFFNPQTVSLIAGNAGKLRTQGVEGDFNWRVNGLDGFSLRGAVAYNDAEYQDYIGQCYPGQTIAAGCNQVANPAGAFTSQVFSGRTPPKAPHWAGRLGFTFETPVSGSGWSVRATSDASYSSAYNFTDALRPDTIQKEFVRLDAALSLNGPDDRWSLSLIGRNLTNRRVVTGGSDIPFTGGIGTGTNGAATVADVSAFVDNPREIFLEASFKL